MPVTLMITLPARHNGSTVAMAPVTQRGETAGL